MELQHNTAIIAPSPRAQYKKLKKLVQTLRITELALADELAEAERTNAYLEIASDMPAYMRGLGLARGKGGDLLRIGRKLTELPMLRAAMAEQRVPWTAAREVVKVATAETEAGWVARAEDWTNRQLRTAILNAALGDEAPDREDRPANPPVVYRFELSAEDAEQVAKAIALVRLAAPDEAGELTDGEVLVQMAETIIAGPTVEHELPAERIRKVVRVCPTCDETELAGLPEDETAPVSEETRAMADCDSEVVDLHPGADGRMNHTVTPRIRRLVFDRDNYRCRVPGCTNRWYLDLHHTCFGSCLRDGPSLLLGCTATMAAITLSTTSSWCAPAVINAFIAISYMSNRTDAAASASIGRPDADKRHPAGRGVGHGV